MKTQAEAKVEQVKENVQGKISDLQNKSKTTNNANNTAANNTNANTAANNTNNANNTTKAGEKK